MGNTLLEDNMALASRRVNATRTLGPSLFGRQRNSSLLDLDLWMPSEIEAISPTVDQLMQFIQASHCVRGHEFDVELAIREALNNAVIHGNRMDPAKSVELHCRCDQRKGVWLIIKDQGEGFDPNAVPEPLTTRGLEAEHGRGIYLMKLLMDEISFERGGTEVHMSKRKTRRLTAE